LILACIISQLIGGNIDEFTMKFVLLSLLILASGIEAWAGPNTDEVKNRGHLKVVADDYDIENLNRTLVQELARETDILKQVKYNLINGDVRVAKTYLAKVASSRSRLRPVIYRYLGIVSFIDGKFSEAYRYLSLKELQEGQHFAKICTLKILSAIALNKKENLSTDWQTCQLRNGSAMSATGFLWMQTLIDLKLHPFSGITKIPFQGTKLSRYEVEDLKILLKLAMYLNQESLVLPELPALTLAQLQDEEVRELVGAIYFRTGSFARAYRFTEGISSPNSENIKGNLYLLREKYELAYAQFKLALEQKHNSQNALERMLPLAWLLGDWEGGAQYAQMLTATPSTQMNKLTLLAAFLMQKSSFAESRKVLKLISERSSRWSELDVAQIGSFVALMQNDRNELIKNSSLACKKNDLVNCWVLFQSWQWENLPLIVKRDEEVQVEPMWEKLSQETFDEPLKETVYINQLDIEELDDKLVQLRPKT
jgi:hypothetical protein